MSDLGDLLRKARTERGITLEHLEETTKIRKRYLEAIEEGKYHILPGNFYVRAFIKQYSEAVGLDPDEVFRLYANVIPSVDPEHTTEPIRMARRNVVNSGDKMSKWTSALLMIAFPVLILGVVYYYFIHTAEPRNNVVEDVPLTNQRASEQGMETPAGSETPPVDQPPVIETPEPTPPPEPESIVTFVENVRFGSNNVERFEVKTTQKLVLELKVVGTECWVGVTHADTKSKYLYQGALKEGDTYKAEYDHNTYINIGRANAIELTINGVAIDMGNEPNPRKFQFDLVASSPQNNPT